MASEITRCNSLIFISLGHLKSDVFETQPADTDELKSELQRHAGQFGRSLKTNFITV